MSLRSRGVVWPPQRAMDPPHRNYLRPFIDRRCRPIFLTACFALWLPSSAAQTFRNVTAQAGIDHIQHVLVGNQSPAQYMSGGAAAGDYDRDGWVDLYVTRMHAPDILYRNKGNGTFEAMSPAVTGLNHASGANGAVWGNIDNDNFPDLYVTTIGEGRNYLYLNNGNGSFREAAVDRGVALLSTSRFSGYSATFGDYDLDGYLDLYTTSWADEGGMATRLFRNLGRDKPGFFIDVTASAGVEMASKPNFLKKANTSFSFAPRFSDMDQDGYPDLLIAADFGSSRIFWNNGNGSFVDGTADAKVGSDENGMGSTLGDYDGDGRLDWFVTSVYDPETIPSVANWLGSGNRLYKNLGQRVFSDVTESAGVRDGAWGWGAAFFDYDNDRDLDLIMTTGINFPQLDAENKYNRDPMRLWRNNTTDPFVEVAVSEGITDRGSGKGLLTFDYDRDGDLDVFVVNTAGKPVLYRNESSNGYSWLKVIPRGVLSNRDGLGAFITVTRDLQNAARTTQIREINAGSNFLGQDEMTAHFGLGTGTRPIDRVTIRWPCGIQQVFEKVPRNSVLTAVELKRETCTSSGYVGWRCRHFTAGELQDERVSGDLADPDRDGLVNGAEYVFGYNPRRNDGASALQTGREQAGSTNFLTVSFSVDPTATDGVVTAETTEDFSKPWTEASAFIEDLGEKDGIGLRKIRMPIGEGAAKFLRLRVTLPSAK